MQERRLRAEGIPRHVAIIMDGNGRWAEARSLDRNEGHRAGLESVREVVRAAHELGVEVLTLYAFSSENWNRPKAEVEELMRLLDHYIDVELEEVIRNGIQVRAMGRLERVPPLTRRKLEDAIARTRDNDEMTLVFALSYGGRQEIVDAVRKVLRDFELGKLSPEHLDDKTFASYLYQPDLRDRISNFLLWQLAYSELYMTSTMWPDFRKTHLVEAISDYQARERRFGLTSQQVRGGRRSPS
jgi:undecaprenyl diphosphate synthase